MTATGPARRVVLDWRPGRIGSLAPCVLCGEPALCRSPETGEPCHKGCAELQLANCGPGAALTLAGPGPGPGPDTVPVPRQEHRVPRLPADQRMRAALGYIANGWLVFLLGRSKRPVANCAACRAAEHDRAGCGCLTCHGFYAATH